MMQPPNEILREGETAVPCDRLRLFHGAIIYGLAAGLRILYAAWVGFTAPLTTDEGECFEPARHLAAGDGYVMVPQQSDDGAPRPTAYRMPGTALLLAVPFWLFGPSIEIARWTCLLTASFSAPLLYLITRRIAPVSAALLAGCGCAVYPTWVYYSTLILSDALFIPLFLLALLATDGAAASPGRRKWFGAGLVWGLAALVRPHALPTCGLVLLYFLRHVSVSRLMMLPLGMLLLLSAWLIRNEIEMGHPILLATEGGETLLGSNNPYVLNDPRLNGMWLSPMAVPEYRDRLQPIKDEVARDRMQNRMALEFMNDNRSALPALAARKIARWLNPITESGGRTRFLVLASYGSLLFLLAAGMFQGTFQRSNLLALALLTTLATLIVTAVYWGNLTRGRLLVEIVWLPWGAASACQLIQSARSRWLTRAPAAP
jgi:hypothetical protein